MFQKQQCGQYGSEARTVREQGGPAGHGKDFGFSFEWDIRFRAQKEGMEPMKQKWQSTSLACVSRAAETT